MISIDTPHFSTNLYRNREVSVCCPIHKFFNQPCTIDLVFLLVWGFIKKNPLKK